MNKKEFTLYDKIINYLMIKSFCMRNNGIHHGRMALALTIYHYGFYTKNHVLVDFSVNLLDSILEDEKNIQTPILNFTNGRIGIGWGMEYLLFKLTEINYNEILRQYLTYIDNRVKEYFLNDSFPPDYSIDVGILHYVLIRNSGCQKRNELQPYPSSFVKGLCRKCSSVSKKEYNQYFMADSYIIDIKTIYPLLCVQNEEFETSLTDGFPNVLLRYLKII